MFQTHRVRNRPRSRRQVAESRVDFRLEHLLPAPETVQSVRHKMQLDARELYPEPYELRQAVAVGLLAPGGADLVPADELLVVVLCDQPHWSDDPPTWLLRTYTPGISRGRVQIGWRPTNRYRLDLPTQTGRIVWRLANASTAVKSRIAGKAEIREGHCYPAGQVAAAEIWVDDQPELAVPEPVIPRVRECISDGAEVSAGDVLVEFHQPSRVYRGKQEGPHPDCCPSDSRAFALGLELNERLYSWCVCNAEGWFETLSKRPGWSMPPEYPGEFGLDSLPKPVMLVRDNPEDILLHRRYKAPEWFKELVRDAMVNGYVVQAPISGKVTASGPVHHALVRQPMRAEFVWISPTGRSDDAVQVTFPGERRVAIGQDVQAGDEIGFVRPPDDPEDRSSGAAQFIRLSLFEAQATDWVSDGETDYPVFPLELVESLAGPMKMELMFDLRQCAPYAWEGVEGAYALPVRGPLFLPEQDELKFHLGSWDFDLQYPKKRGIAE